MSFNEKKRNEFLEIPYAEHIVPFPNFASVLMQHAREFPNKIALKFEEKQYSYYDIICLSLSVELPVNDVIISFGDIENDLLLLLSCLVQGRIVKLDFKENTDNIFWELKTNKTEVKYFDPPYVRLDDKALTLNGEFEFSQYNILVAAQAVGNAFKLFREGAAYCPPRIDTIADLIFGVLGPLYFSKSVYFIFIDKSDFYQYAWNKDINSSLRDHVMLFYDNNKRLNSYKLLNSYDQALGLGKVITSEGKEVILLGFEIEKDFVKGHCLGDKL